MCNKELLKIVREVKRQDMSHFGELYGVFDRLINIYAKRIDFEDAVQELTVFLLEVIYEIDADRFKEDSSDALKRYVAVALRNKYITLSKESQKRLSECGELFDGVGATAFESDTKIALADGLKLLSERQRLAVIGRYVYGFSDAEMADRLCITRQSVHRLEMRGLKTLREYYGA